MKKLFAAFLVILSLISVPGAFAADDAFTKLGRGVADIVTSPLEFLVSYSVLAERGNPIVTVVGGTLHGAVMTVTRILAGVYEIVTFPFPLPANYAPIMEPATPIEAIREMQK
jgi:putative exosortase-associated protein (TIGR04073 family)